MGRCVVIFRIGSLGDTIVALPAFHRIRKWERDAHIVLLTNAPVDGGVKAASSYQVLEGSGLVDDYIQYGRTRGIADFVELWIRLRRLRPVRVYYLMPTRTWLQVLRDALFLSLIGARQIVGLSLWRRLSDRRFNSSTGRYESEATRLYRSIGADPTHLTQSDFSPRLTTREFQVAEQALNGFSESRRLIAISLGTKAPCNDWGDLCWKDLARILAKSLPGSSLVLLGSKDEYSRSEQLREEFGGAVLNLCGNLSPRESGAVLSKADVFIGHDSGPMHLASAVGTPTVAIFSARNLPGIWFPFDNEENVFYTKVNCQGCGLEVCIEQKMRCIRSIEPKSVAQKVLQILSTRGSLAPYVPDRVSGARPHGYATTANPNGD